MSFMVMMSLLLLGIAQALITNVVAGLPGNRSQEVVKAGDSWSGREMMMDPYERRLGDVQPRTMQVQMVEAVVSEHCLLRLGCVQPHLRIVPLQKDIGQQVVPSLRLGCVQPQVKSWHMSW
jgi:hypothetical protein